MRYVVDGSRLGLLVMGLVIALAALGIVSALWSKTLTVDGTVYTGDVDGQWSFVGCFDLEDQLPEPKDVGNTTAVIDPEDPAILHFNIENGYPSYTGDCEVEYTYTGSIPVKVESITFVPGPELTNCQVDQSSSTGSFVASCDQLTVTWANGLCTQLEPGDFLGASLRAHVEQPAEQNATYTFQVLVELVQWNESECP